MTGVADDLDDRGFQVTETVRYKSDRVGILEAWSCSDAAEQKQDWRDYHSDASHHLTVRARVFAKGADKKSDMELELN